MLDNDTALDNLSTMQPTTYDTLLVQATNGLQNITDPRIRFNTLALLFAATCRALQVNQKKVLEVTNRALVDAHKQDTAELRGILDYIKGEY